MQGRSRFMNQTRLAVLAAVVFASAGAAAQDKQAGDDAVVNPVAARQQAQEIAQGDPARWYRNDTEQQTLRKELGAALQEAQNACRQQPSNERKACLQEARAAWQRDTAQLRNPGQQ